jgi:hypothetical protein
MKHYKSSEHGVLVACAMVCGRVRQCKLCVARARACMHACVRACARVCVWRTDLANSSSTATPRPPQSLLAALGYVCGFNKSQGGFGSFEVIGYRGHVFPRPIVVRVGAGPCPPVFSLPPRPCPPLVSSIRPLPSHPPPPPSTLSRRSAAAAARTTRSRCASSTRATRRARTWQLTSAASTSSCSECRTTCGTC